jgi:hypothetical protein
MTDTRTRPNTFLIGAPKCGTSALAQYLSEHPGVFFSNPKEPFFLCSDFAHLRKRNGILELDDYLRLFEGANPLHHKVIGEGSTNYLRSETAISEALTMCPDAKFIVMLRDPIHVAHAYHMEQVFARNEPEANFETAWNLQLERAKDVVISDHCWAPDFLEYREVVSYEKQLTRFCGQVPPHQRLILLFDDFQRDIAAEYRKVLSFLDIADDLRTDFPKVNAAKEHRYPWLADFVLTPPKPLVPIMLSLRNLARKIPASDTLKRQLNVATARSALNDKFESKLFEQLKNEVQAVERFLSRDLKHWYRK